MSKKNKMKSITSQLLTSLLITTLLSSCWGEPESKLKKTTENIVKVENFESFLGTSWSNDKNDKSTSEISFDIEGLKDTKGFFEDFDILFKVSDNNPEDAKIKVSINVNSINTDNTVRDEALMEKDFFHSEKFPVIEFYSKKITRTDSNFVAKGYINMMGKRNKLSFTFKNSGFSKNEKGEKLAIFEGEISLNRTDFGMDHVATVGDMVDIIFYCELIEETK